METSTFPLTYKNLKIQPRELNANSYIGYLWENKWLLFTLLFFLDGCKETGDQ
jgi:hypothetical protein